MIRSAHFVADNPGAAACSAELSNPTRPSLKGAGAGASHALSAAVLAGLLCDNPAGQAFADAGNGTGSVRSGFSTMPLAATIGNTARAATVPLSRAQWRPCRCRVDRLAGYMLRTTGCRVCASSVPAQRSNVRIHFGCGWRVPGFAAAEKTVVSGDSGTDEPSSTAWWSRAERNAAVISSCQCRVFAGFVEPAGDQIRRGEWAQDG